ncbi:MAG: hypothetical protein ACEY3J_00315 [Arsenophonus sp.]
MLMTLKTALKEKCNSDTKIYHLTIHEITSKLDSIANKSYNYYLESKKNWYDHLVEQNCGALPLALNKML